MCQETHPPPRNNLEKIFMHTANSKEFLVSIHILKSSRVGLLVWEVEFAALLCCPRPAPGS